MRKKIFIVLLVAFLLLAGCVEQPLTKPTMNVNCCNRTTAEQSKYCEVVNPPAEFKFKPIMDGCDLTKNTCNVSVFSVKTGTTKNSGGGNGLQQPIQQEQNFIEVSQGDMELPICSGATESTCVQDECVAMVCGDFLYRPQLPQPILTEEEKAAGIGIPVGLTEEPGFSLYKADCIFRKTDENLSRIMKRTGAMVNNVRFGLGGPGSIIGTGTEPSDYELYKYMFPASDKFCSLNTFGTVDRYMNYFDMCAIPNSACPTPITPDQLSNPLLAVSKYECIPYTAFTSEQNKQEQKVAYPFLYTTATSQNTLKPSGYKMNSFTGAFVTAFYARALSAQFTDLMFNQKQIAPFECSGTECVSGYCSKQNYHRSLIVLKNGTKEPIECYSSFASGRKVVACTAVVKQTNGDSGGFIPARSFSWNKETNDMSASVNFQATEVFSMRIKTDNLQFSQKYAAFAYQYHYGQLDDDGLSATCDQQQKEDNTFQNNWNAIRAFQLIRPFAAGVCDASSTCLISALCEEDCGGPFLGYTGELCADTRHHLAENQETVLVDVESTSFQSGGTAKSTRPPAAAAKYLSVVPTSFDSSAFNALPTINSDGHLDFNKLECPAGSIPFDNAKGVCFTSAVYGGKKFPPVNTIYFFNSQEPLIVNGHRLIGYGVGKPDMSYNLGDGIDRRSTNNLIAACNMKSQKENAAKPDYTLIDMTAMTYDQEDMLKTIGSSLAEDTILDAIKYMVRPTDTISVSDLALTSAPWAVAYMKCEDKEGGNCRPVTLSKPQYSILEKNNVFGLEESDNLEVLEPQGMVNDGGYVNYVLGSRYVYVIHSLGDCEMEAGSDLPQLTEYGWCEPCFYATMAYGSAPWGNFPKATNLKESDDTKKMLVNYLQNGVMPVLDMRTYFGEYHSVQYMYDSSSDDSKNYAIALTSHMLRTKPYELQDALIRPADSVAIGPVVTVVNSPMAYAKEEANIIGDACDKCIVAYPFKVTSTDYLTDIYPGDNGQDVKRNSNQIDPITLSTLYETFKEDSGMAQKVDAVVLEFPITDVMQDYASNPDVQWDGLTAKERADLVVDRMFNYAWAVNNQAAKSGHKVMPIVILFNVENAAGRGWPEMRVVGADENTADMPRRFYADFFSELYASKDKLRKAGVMGIVYTPFEYYSPSGNRENSIVRNSVSDFGVKFCSFQEGSYAYAGVSALTKNVMITEMPTGATAPCDPFQGSERINKTGSCTDRTKCVLTCYNYSENCQLSCAQSSAQGSDQLDCTVYSNPSGLVNYNDKALSCVFTSMATPQPTKRFCKMECSFGQCKFSCNGWKMADGQTERSCTVDASSWVAGCYAKGMAPSGALYCIPCLAGENCNKQSETCDDGTQCVAPDATTGPYRCPRGYVSKLCKQCNTAPGDISCLMRKTATPTDVDRYLIKRGYPYDSYFQNYSYSQLTEFNADLIATLPAKDKCCLVGANSTLYTFIRQEVNLAGSVPVVFSKNPPTTQAAELQDCGFVDSSAISNDQLKICGVSKTADEVLECKKKGDWFTYLSEN